MSTLDYVIGAAFFDLDSTLTRNMSTGKFMAQHLGIRKEHLAAEEALAAGEIDTEEVCRINAAAWKRRKPAEIHAWLDELPLMDGIEDVVDWCRRHGIAPYIASVSWNFIGNYLVDRFGFEGCCGPELEERAGMFSGRVANFFDENDKRIYVEGLCEKLYLQPYQVAAIGDGHSDLPLFEFAGCPIAFNATNEVKKLARFSARSNTDLRVVLPFLEEWEREM